MPTNAARSVSTRGGQIQSESAGSQFDERKPPTLPAGLQADVRKHAKRILEHNVHLWDQSQVQAIVRLARLMVDLDAMNADLEAKGMWVADRFGEDKINPMINARQTVMASALALERQLSITFTARGAGVKNAELQKPAQAKPKPGEKKAGVRPLRLA